MEVVSRDRAGCYAKGATDGAPGAVQVADKWHLLKNLGDATQKYLAKNSGKLKEATLKTEGNYHQDNLQEPDISEQKSPSLPKSHRELKYLEVKAMKGEGKSIKAIASLLGMNRRTVRKYIAAEEFPKRATPVYTYSKTRPYKDYLLQRWNEGEHNGKTLWKEIVSKGFEGSASSVYRVISGFPGYEGSKGAEYHRANSRRSISPRKTCILLSKSPDDLKNKELVFCSILKDICPSIETIQSLVHDFQNLLRASNSSELDTWVKKATECEAEIFANFGKGVQKDYDAIKATIEFPWTNGQVEGQVNRLKTIKRSMYGRSRFALLKKRVMGPP